MDFSHPAIRQNTMMMTHYEPIVPDEKDVKLPLQNDKKQDTQKDMNQTAQNNDEKSS